MFQYIQSVTTWTVAVVLTQHDERRANGGNEIVSGDHQIEVEIVPQDTNKKVVRSFESIFGQLPREVISFSLLFLFFLYPHNKHPIERFVNYLYIRQ